MVQNNLYKYQRIAKEIQAEIFIGKYKGNALLPSIRDYAKKFSVNSATILRSYSLLKQRGFVYTRRTSGFYVCTDIDAIRKKCALLAITSVLENLKAIGFTKVEIENMILSYYK